MTGNQLRANFAASVSQAALCPLQVALWHTRKPKRTRLWPHRTLQLQQSLGDTRQVLKKSSPLDMVANRHSRPCATVRTEEHMLKNKGSVVTVIVNQTNIKRDQLGLNQIFLNSKLRELSINNF